MALHGSYFANLRTLRHLEVRNKWLHEQVWWCTGQVKTSLHFYRIHSTVLVRVTLLCGIDGSWTITEKLLLLNGVLRLGLWSCEGQKVFLVRHLQLFMPRLSPLAWELMFRGQANAAGWKRRVRFFNAHCLFKLCYLFISNCLIWSLIWYL